MFSVVACVFINFTIQCTQQANTLISLVTLSIFRRQRKLIDFLLILFLQSGCCVLLLPLRCVLLITYGVVNQNDMHQLVYMVLCGSQDLAFSFLCLVLYKYFGPPFENIYDRVNSIQLKTFNASVSIHQIVGHVLF